MDAERLYELLWGFAGPRVVTVAARCGIIKGWPRKRLAASKWRQSSPWMLCHRQDGAGPLRSGSARAPRRLLRGRENLRAFFLAGEDDLTPFVDHAHHLYDRWGATLEDWLRTGLDTRRRRSGSDLEKFSQACAPRPACWLPGLVGALNGLRGISQVLDLGGGIGGYARIFCRARPELHVTVLDTPEVADLGDGAWPALNSPAASSSREATIMYAPWARATTWCCWPMSCISRSPTRLPG